MMKKKHYTQTDALLVGLGAGLLEEREEMNYPRDTVLDSSIL